MGQDLYVRDSGENKILGSGMRSRYRNNDCDNKRISHGVPPWRDEYLPSPATNKRVFISSCYRTPSGGVPGAVGVGRIHHTAYNIF